jgi:Arc/MetJ-type ribon-helix-helix transcriptional regulator
MSRPKSVDNGVKYTVVLPESSINDLKELVGSKNITSINAGVREAIEDYIVKKRSETYRKELQAAVKDPEFIKRNDDIMKSFKSPDKEAEEMISAW